MQKAYRADIDGLRAVAVLPVVLFHAGVPGFSGGFTGVDVFFVISGYLIMGILDAEARQGSLSIARFYQRRIRRIAPALLAVFSASLIAGYVLLLPDQYADLAKSLLAGEAFLSNVWFWRESGYFAAQGGILPLLHTWSLAVEEQFYLFVPLLMALLAQRRKLLWRLIIAFGVASFAVSCVGIVTSPGATFYLIPTRAWELFLGGGLNIAPAMRGRRGREILSSAGLALILLGIFALSESSPFPGPLALLPCAGTAAIIYAGDETGVARLLAWRPMVLIGLTSYSLYLWHWPIIIFTRQFVGRAFTTTETVFCIMASLVAALLSWRFIERPTRDRNLVSTKALLIGAGVMTGALAIAAAAVIGLGGIPSRFSPEVRLLASGTDDFSPIATRCGMASPEISDARCHLGGKGVTFILAGDSHSGAIAEAVHYAAGKAGRGGTLAPFNSCLALVDWKPTAMAMRDAWGCERRNRNLFARMRDDPQLDTLIVAGFWLPAFQRDPDELRAAIARTTAYVRSLGKKLVVLHGEPSPIGDLPSQLAMAKARGRPAPLVPMPEPDGIVGPSISDAICPAGSCASSVDGRPTYSDGNHLSRAANERILGPWLVRTRALF